MGQMQKCRGVSTTVQTDGDNWMSVTYHQTKVVRFQMAGSAPSKKRQVILDTGGWYTATTKARMNQASNQFALGYRVFQRGYQWFVEVDGKLPEPFNGRTISFFV